MAKNKIKILLFTSLMGIIIIDIPNNGSLIGLNRQSLRTSDQIPIKLFNKPARTIPLDQN